MTPYSLRDNIPIPAQAARAWKTRPPPRTRLSITMAIMEVGQYFEVTTLEERTGVRNRAHMFKPKRFAMRRFQRGWRVWRIR